MFINLFRRFRNKLIGLNATSARFDILQSKLDVITEGMNLTGKTTDSTANSLLKNICSNQLDSINGNASSPPDLRVKPDELIRITFIIQHSSIWTSWRSVWDACQKDDRVVANVVLTPYIHPLTSTAVTYDELRELLIRENVSFYTSDYYNLDEFKPHVVFLQNPYEETRPGHLRINEIQKRFARISYVPYGLEMGGGCWNLKSQFDSDLQRKAWRIFARSNRHKKMFGKYCKSGNAHVVVTGHPKFDVSSRLLSVEDNSSLIQKANGRKVILWTPHFAVGFPPTWSTYRIYSETIFEIFREESKLFLLIRPHPLFFQSMRENNVWDADGETKFRSMIDESENCYLDERDDYLEAFSVADGLMTDVGSFLLEFLPTGKPILYLHHKDGLGMNDDADLVNHLYTATDASQIIDFVRMIDEDEDFKKSVRKDSIEDFLFGLDGNVGKRICDHIVSALYGGDNPSPVALDANSLQIQSNTYWIEAKDTYLAPKEYYDIREKILREVLTSLPTLQNAIDIGCGDGRFTRLIAQHATEVKAYDISEHLIEKAKVDAVEFCIDNIVFQTLEFDEIKPLEKYDLVACMGVTSCMIDDVKFLRILDIFRMLVKPHGYLLLIDTLSSEMDHVASDQNGYVAKYRSQKGYCDLIARREFILKQEIMLKEIKDRNMINKLFLFEKTGDEMGLKLN